MRSGSPIQPSLFDEPRREPPRREPDLEFVRKCLRDTLRLMRNAQFMPFYRCDAISWTRRFPALAGMLPPDEAAPLIAEFEAQYERLKDHPLNPR